MPDDLNLSPQNSEVSVGWHSFKGKLGNEISRVNKIKVLISQVVSSSHICLPTFDEYRDFPM